MLDPFHIFRGGGSLESIAKLRGEQVAIMHFNDSPSLAPARNSSTTKTASIPATGISNLKRELDLLRQIGYDRWLSLELFREDLWAANPLEVARVGLEKMRAW